MNETELREMIRTLTNLVNDQSIQIAAIQNNLRILTETVNNFVVTTEEATEAIAPPVLIAQQLAPMFETIQGLVPGGVSERPMAMTVDQFRELGREVYETPSYEEVRTRSVTQIREIGGPVITAVRTLDLNSRDPVVPGGVQSQNREWMRERLRESPFALRHQVMEEPPGYPTTLRNLCSEIELPVQPVEETRKPHPLDL